MSNYFTAEGITDEYYKIYQRAYHIEVFELEESGRSFRFVKEFPPLKSSDNKSLATNDSGYKSDFNSYAARSMMTTNGQILIRIYDDYKRVYDLRTGDCISEIYVSGNSRDHCYDHKNERFFGFYYYEHKYTHFTLEGFKNLKINEEDKPMKPGTI